MEMDEHYDSDSISSSTIFGPFTRKEANELEQKLQKGDWFENLSIRTEKLSKFSIDEIVKINEFKR
jgi:formyltetrahydrofolate synthetase